MLLVWLARLRPARAGRQLPGLAAVPGGGLPRGARLAVLVHRLLADHGRQCAHARPGRGADGAGRLAQASVAGDHAGANPRHGLIVGRRGAAAVRRMGDGGCRSGAPMVHYSARPTATKHTKFEKPWPRRPPPPTPAALSGQLQPGDPAPWFRQRSTGNPNYAFDTVAGRYIVLCFFGTAADEAGQAALAAFAANRALFDDVQARLLRRQPRSGRRGRGAGRRAILPGIRFFWDFDGADQPALRRRADRGRRTTRRCRCAASGWCSTRRCGSARLPVHRRTAATGTRSWPSCEPCRRSTASPASGCRRRCSSLPNVFEPELLPPPDRPLRGSMAARNRASCARSTARPSLIYDHGHKRRRDCIDRGCRADPADPGRIIRRINPGDREGPSLPRRRAWSATSSPATRPRTAAISAPTATTPPRARRIAASPSRSTSTTNSRAARSAFPNTARASFKAPPGGAVVFSCSLLHAVSKVTAGRRYAFLPFLYDEAAAKIREANNRVPRRTHPYPG